MVVFPKREIPTVPIIKRGPELLVKVISLSASSLVQSPFFLKLVTIFAPTGYPAYNSHNKRKSTLSWNIKNRPHNLS